MLAARFESFGLEVLEPVQDMSVLAITAEATQAHSRVITTGLSHVDGRDDCIERGLRPGQVEQCPYYLEADLAYTALVHQGQKSSAH